MTPQNAHQLMFIALGWLIIALAVVLINSQNRHDSLNSGAVLRLNKQNTPGFQPSPDPSEFINSFYQSAHYAITDSVRVLPTGLNSVTWEAWKYPNASIIKESNASLALETPDNSDTIVSWYEEKLSELSGIVLTKTFHNPNSIILKSMNENGYTAVTISREASVTRINVSVVNLTTGAKSISI